MRLPIQQYALPLLGFFILGGLLLLLEQYTFNSQAAIHTEEKRLELSPTQLVSRQSDNSIAAIDDLINEEIYYQEGLALGIADNDPIIIERLRLNMGYVTLDKSENEPSDDDHGNTTYTDSELIQQALSLNMHNTDPVIRRRVIQQTQQFIQDHYINGQYIQRSKTKFQEKSLGSAEPTDEELLQFMQTNASKFASQDRWSLQQIYFSDPLSDEAAEEILIRLNNTPPQPQIGTPSILPKRLTGTSSHQIKKQFGEGFFAALQTLQKDQADLWQGPITSAYGSHYIQLTQFIPGSLPPLKSVYNKAYLGWQQKQRKYALQHFLKQRRNQYQVMIYADQTNAHREIQQFEERLIAENKNSRMTLIPANEFAQYWVERTP